MDVTLSKSLKDSENVASVKKGTCPLPGLQVFDREAGKREVKGGRDVQPNSRHKDSNALQESFLFIHDIVSLFQGLAFDLKFLKSKSMTNLAIKIHLLLTFILPGFWLCLSVTYICASIKYNTQNTVHRQIELVPHRLQCLPVCLSTLFPVFMQSWFLIMLMSCCLCLLLFAFEPLLAIDLYTDPEILQVSP